MTPGSVLTTHILSPLTGSIVPLGEVADPTFAKKVLGDGFAVEPDADQVVAPASGIVLLVANTGHAFALKTSTGVEILVHMGIDTVQLKGVPFNLTIAPGDTVEAGQPIGTMDCAAVKTADRSATTMVIFTNLTKLKGDLSVGTGDVAAGAEVATVTLPDSPSLDPVPGVVAAAPAATTPARPTACAIPDGLTGYDLLAHQIVDGIGGRDNVKSVLRCITRVRFYLKDQSRADDEVVSNLDGVIDVIKAGGQYQVVIGAAVEDVFQPVNRLVSGAVASVDVEEEEVERPTTAIGWAKFGFSSLIGVITGSMIPVIGLLAASGILKGILALLTQFNIVEAASSTYTFIDAMSSSMFYFLPLIIGYTAARRLGSDPIIVAIIGGVLVYPSIVAMSNPTNPDYKVVGQLGATVFNGDFFGIPVSLPQGNAYAYSIFPIIVAAWLAARVEPLLKKHIPAVVRMIFAPLLEVLIVSTLVLIVFGPIIMFLSGGVANGVNWLLGLNYAVAGLLIGALYQCLVIFGLHWAVIPLIAAQLASNGSSPLNAIVSATMIAQGGGALAIWIKTKDKRIKTLAGPATISAFCGITEPAMYGLNLKYGRVFIMASAGGAVGGLLTGLLNVNMYGFTGGFVGFPSFVNPHGLDGNLVGFLIASTAALTVSFTLTYLFGFDDSVIDNERSVKKVRLGKREPAGT